MIKFREFLRGLFIGLATLGLAMLVSCTLSPSDVNPKPIQEWSTFSSPTYNYTFEYPFAWQAREYLDGLKGNKDIIATVIAPTPFTAAITIKRIQIEDPKIEDIAEWGEKLITSRFDSYELDDLGSIELSNGQTTLTRIYLTAIDKPITSKFMDVYIARENDGFIIRLEAIESKYDSVIEDFEHLIESLTFTTPDRV